MVVGRQPGPFLYHGGGGDEDDDGVSQTQIDFVAPGGNAKHSILFHNRHTNTFSISLSLTHLVKARQKFPSIQAFSRPSALLKLILTRGPVCSVI